ncbi:hypothetical protein ACLMJK_001915 [Lecanora helva]
MVVNINSNLILDESIPWNFSEEAYAEAAADSRSLQAIIESILDWVQSSYENIQQTIVAKRGASEFERLYLRHIEQLANCLQVIQVDVDELVETYRHPPIKSFVRATYDQLRAIYRLSHLLPALRPLFSAPHQQYPGVVISPPHQESSSSTEGAQPRDSPAELEERQRDYWDDYQGSQARTSCLDRLPRSLASSPFERTSNKTSR